MCSSNAVKVFDPVLSSAVSVTKKTKEILNPEMPSMPAPPALQEQKTPDMAALRKRRTGSSTLLTGPTGVATGALTTGAPTLLGG